MMTLPEIAPEYYVSGQGEDFRSRDLRALRAYSTFNIYHIVRMILIIFGKVQGLF
jgi:hypothetical protein